MAQGLFTIDRAMLSHHIVGIQNHKRFVVWVWMLAAARWKPSRIWVRGEEITLNRGAFFASIRVISQETGVPKGQIERLVRDLKNGEMIETALRAGGTIITICNYDKYQDFSAYSETVRKTANRTQTGHKRKPEETPEESNDDGGADETTRSLPASHPMPSHLRDILQAIEEDAASLSGKSLRSADSLREVQIWTERLDLTNLEQIAIIKDVMQRKRDGPPSSLKYFTKAMTRYAASKSECAIKMNSSFDVKTQGYAHERPRSRARNAHPNSTVSEARQGLSDGSVISIIGGDFAPGASRRSH